MEELINIIGSYGMDAIIIALLINVATSIAKYPIKKLSRRLEPKGINLTKYVTLLPVVFGFIFSVLATGLFLDRGIFWNARTPILALSSGSLSLAVYAVFEKFTGKDKKRGTALYTEEEIREIKDAVETLKTKFGLTESGEHSADVSDIVCDASATEVVTTEIAAEQPTVTPISAGKQPAVTPSATETETERKLFVLGGGRQQECEE